MKIKKVAAVLLFSEYTWFLIVGDISEKVKLLQL